MVVLRVLMAASLTALGGCAGSPTPPAEGDAPAAIAVARDSAARTDPYPVCTAAQLAGDPLTRDLTVPYAARVYFTALGPCAPRLAANGEVHPRPSLARVSVTPSPVAALEPVRAALIAPEPLDAFTAATTPAPAPLEAAALRRAFDADIRAGRIAVEPAEAGALTLVLRGDAAFAAGSARLRPAAKGLLKRVGWALAESPVTLVVAGHSDATPVTRSRFPDNLSLSRVRAQRAAALLRNVSTPPLPVRAEGHGARVPRADNDTAAGRAENRRIEITVRPVGALS